MQMLVAVAGLPGVGKTTVSAAIARRLDATRLRTDVLRKELFDEPTDAQEETERVYEALRARAAEGDASDADVSVYERLKGEFEPVESEHVRVDNSGTLSETRTQIERAFPEA